MASETDGRTKRKVKAVESMSNVTLSKAPWTPEEDSKLAEVNALYGAKRWNSIAVKAGLNRCGKSCRLRWMNYLRPNIKRGNISDEEEDLIIRLHKLLGNSSLWALIAGRLPGRTDNEIKNYWNSHLIKEDKAEGQAPKWEFNQQREPTKGGRSGKEDYRRFQKKLSKSEKRFPIRKLKKTHHQNPNLILTGSLISQKVP